MQEVISQAVVAAMHLNKGVVQRGRELYVKLADGSEQLMCSSMEGHKFALACTCGRGHVRYSTLSSVRSMKSLLCQYCHHASPAWREAHKRKVFPSEKKGMKSLKQEGLDCRVACEVLLPFWRGRVDFYDIPTRTAMQADGGKRGAKRHSKLPGKQLQLDLECCLRAWQEGVRLLRLHTKSSNWGATIKAAIQLRYSKFVMLASEYDGVAAGSGAISCIDWCKRKLEGAQYMVHTETKSHLFFPAPTL